MTLTQKIADAIDQAPAHVSPQAPHRASAETDAHRLGLDLVAVGPVGLAFRQLDFADLRANRAELSADDLRAWADGLAARLTYLMEPLVVVEVDDLAGQADLRSKAPTPRAGGKSYYEVRLGRDRTLRLARVRFDDATRRREPAPCQMTSEVVERLADDLVASLP